MPLKVFGLGMTFGITLGLGVAGCANLQQDAKTAKDVVKLAEDACVVLRDVAPKNEQAIEVCAREEELRPYIKLILGARARGPLPTDGSAPTMKDSK